MYRYKANFGERMRSRDFARQQTEAKINCHLLNRYQEL